MSQLAPNTKCNHIDYVSTRHSVPGLHQLPKYLPDIAAHDTSPSFLGQNGNTLSIHNTVSLSF